MKCVRNGEAYVFTFGIARDVRVRVFKTLEGYVDSAPGRFDELLSALRTELLKQYGSLSRSAYDATRMSDDPTIEHFFAARDEQVLDFIELFFQQPQYTGGQDGVDDVNEVFREQGIGFSFSPYVRREAKRPFFNRSRAYIETEFPSAIKRSDSLLHQEIVQPVLELLTDVRFKIANKEFLDAHAAFRRGDWDNTLTLSCAAFESVLKTICVEKGWALGGNETCSQLIERCRANGLFPPFYRPMMEAVGTIRNKLGDAHGRGPSGTDPLAELHACHFLHVTGSHILFLAKLAGLAT